MAIRPSGPNRGPAYGNNAFPHGIKRELENLVNEKDAREQAKSIDTINKAFINLVDTVDDLHGKIEDLEETVEGTSRRINRSVERNSEYRRRIYDKEFSYREELSDKAKEVLTRNEDNLYKTFIGRDNAYESYVKSRQQFMESAGKKADTAMSKRFDNYNRILQQKIAKAARLREQQNLASNKAEEAFYAMRVNRVEKSIARETAATREFFDSMKDKMQDFQREGWERTFDEMADFLEDFGKSVKDVAKDTGEEWKSQFGKGEGGLLSTLNDFLGDISNISFMEAFNMNSLVNDLTSNSQSIFDLKNELFAQRGMNRDMVQQWYNTIAAYNSSDLKNALSNADILDAITQMTDMGITSNEEFQRYYKSYLDSTIGLGLSPEEIGSMMELDQNLNAGTAVINSINQDVAALLQDQNLSLKANSKDLTSKITELDNKAMALANLDGSVMIKSQDQLDSFQNAQLAAIAATTDAMAGDSSLAQAYQSLADAVMNNTVYDDPTLRNSLATAIGVDLTDLRDMMINGNQAEQQRAANLMIQAIINNAKTTGTGSLSRFFLNNAELGLPGIDEYSDAIRALDARTENGLVSKIDESYGEIQKAIANSSEVDLENQVEGRQVTLADQITNAIQEHGLGQLASSVMGYLNISLSDIYLTMMAISKSDLIKKGFSAVSNWLGGKIGGTPGDWLKKLSEVLSPTNIPSTPSTPSAPTTSVPTTSVPSVPTSTQSATKLGGQVPEQPIQLNKTTAEIEELAGKGSTSAQANLELIEQGKAVPADKLSDATQNLANQADDLAKATSKTSEAVASASDDLANGIVKGTDTIGEATQVATNSVDDVAKAAIEGSTKSSGLLSKVGSTVSKIATPVAAILSGVELLQRSGEGAAKAAEWTGSTDTFHTDVAKMSSILGGSGNGLSDGDFWENFLEVGGNAATWGSIGLLAGGPLGGLLGAGLGALAGAIGGENLAKKATEITDPNNYEKLPENGTFEEKLAVAERNAAKVDAIPHYANGLSEVPADDYLAMLHKGEAVLTKSQAEAVRSDGGLGLIDNLSQLSNSARTTNLLSQEDISNSIREALYGNADNVTATSIFDAVRNISDGQIEYNTKSLQFEQDNYRLLNKITPSVNRLVNNTSTGTVTSRSTFSSSSPSTKPAGIIKNQDKSLLDQLTVTGELTPTEKENIYTDEDGNIVVKNPSTGDVAVGVGAEDAVRPSHALGTPFLPQDEVALIHQGEMIVPADKNPLSSATNTTTVPLMPNNDDIIEALRWLGSIITRNSESIEQAINNSNARPVARTYQQGPSMTDIAFRY